MARRSLSLHHLSMLQARPSELIDAAGSAGFSHCGIRIVSPDGPDGDRQLVDLIHDPAARRTARRHLDAHAVGVLDVEALWLRPTTDVSALEPALEAASDLGARYFLTVGFDEDRARLTDSLGRFADLAGAYDITVALEFITYTAITNLFDAWRLVDELGQDNLALLVDALQFFRAGAEYEVLDSIPDRLLPYAQICDGRAESPATVEGLRAEAREDRFPPGQGELDVPRLLATLPPDIPLAVEAPTHALAGRPHTEIAQVLHTATLDLLARSDTT